MPMLIQIPHTPEHFQKQTVFRCLLWDTAEIGDILTAVVNRRAQKDDMQILGNIRLTNVRREQLDSITQEDVVKEGYLYLTPSQFIEAFMDHHRCGPAQMITRLEFEHLPDIITCDCGAINDVLGAWDNDGYWHSLNAIHKFNSDAGHHAFGGALSEIKTSVAKLNRKGKCQKCRESTVRKRLHSYTRRDGFRSEPFFKSL